MARKGTSKAKRAALAIPVPGPGRKSLYQEAFADQARKLCLLGATDRELADFFAVAESTINLWKIEHPAFSESIRAGKVAADADVADSLYKLATGHTVTAEKLVKTSDGFEAVRFKQYIPGDPGAAYRWLLNRRRQDWSDKQLVEHSGTIRHEQVEVDADDFARRVSGLAARNAAPGGAGETQH